MAVLLVLVGLALSAGGAMAALAKAAGKARGHGRNRGVVLLRLDDDLLAEVAAVLGDHHDDLAAAIHGPPRGPRGEAITDEHGY